MTFAPTARRRAPGKACRLRAGSSRNPGRARCVTYALEILPSAQRQLARVEPHGRDRIIFLQWPPWPPPNPPPPKPWPRRCSSSRASGRSGPNCSSGSDCTPSATCSSSSPATTKTSATSATSTQLEEGKLQTVRGVVEDIDLRSTGAGGCILGVLDPLPDRPPAGHLVQPALHARAVRLRPAGDALRQAEVRRAGLADGPSAGRNARPRRKRSR